MVDSPFNKDSKTIFVSRKALILGGPPENLGELGITGTSIVMQIEGGQFREKISVSTPWYQRPSDSLNFLHADQIKKKKNEKTQFSIQHLTTFKGPPLPNYKDVTKNVSYDQTFYVLD